MSTHKEIRMFEPALIGAAILDSFKKLNPRLQVKNPVMFVVEVVSVLVTGLWIQALRGQGEAPAGFILAVAVWLWFTLCCSRTSRRLWPRVAARRRPKSCARPVATPRQSASPSRRASPPGTSCVRARCARATRCWSGRKPRPRRRHHRRGHRFGGRGAITGESAPVIREPAATGARSPAARACSRIGWWSSD